MPLKILLLEDDKNHAKALKTLFQKRGMEVSLAHRVPQAEYMTFVQAYDLIMVDLLIPQMTGLDFVKKLLSKNLISHQNTLWLMSGVLKTTALPNFIQKRYQYFVTKPLNTHKINDKIDEWLAPRKNPLTRMQQLLYTPQGESPALPDFDPEDTFPPHQLMFVYVLLYSSRFTGKLHIQYKDSETVSLIFKTGRITDLKMKDTSSFLGNLLIREKLITPQTLKRVLNTPSHKPLGDRLVTECVMSPHLVQESLKKQMKLRLMRTLSLKKTVKIRWVKEEDPSPFHPTRQASTSFDITDLLSMVEEWGHKHVNSQWLKDFFKPLSEMQIQTSNSPFKVPLKEVSSHIITTAQALSVPSLPLGVFVRKYAHVQNLPLKLCIRLLLRSLNLKHESKRQALKENFDQTRIRLQSFLNTMDTKNYFEWLNLPWAAAGEDVEKNYKNIIKLFHPDGISKNTPQDLLSLYERCFVHITKAYNTLKDTKTRNRYIQQIKTGRNEDVVTIYNDYEKGKSALEQDDFSGAMKTFESILNHKKSPEDTLVYYLWARLKYEENLPLSRNDKNKLLQMFDTVPLSTQESFVFFVAKGLLMKKIGERKAAYNLLSAAIRLNPSNAKIRQERFALKTKKKKSFFQFFKKSA